MSDQKSIYVIETNDFARDQLGIVLAGLGLDQVVEIVPNAPDVADCAVIEVEKPMRIGAVIDKILYYSNRDQAHRDRLNLGSGRYVDCRLGFYYAQDDAIPVRLTEKEISLLNILADAKGGSIAREPLLETVWQYADGVETHTLETHIYRLRQKIEIDPARPQILQTNDQGYFLSIEEL